MTVGRPPKPTLLKKLAGNPGKRALNKREPVPPGKLREPPAWLDDDARAEWRYVMECAPDGLLRRVDRATLTSYCTAAVQHRKAYERLQREGLTIPTMTGEKTHPAATIMSAQAATMQRAAAEMGFTPASRPRVVMPEQSSTADPWADLADN
jgi:P27 family predicted phage terminase small subunit